MRTSNPAFCSGPGEGNENLMRMKPIIESKLPHLALELLEVLLEVLDLLPQLLQFCIHLLYLLLVGLGRRTLRNTMSVISPCN